MDVNGGDDEDDGMEVIYSALEGSDGDGMGEEDPRNGGDDTDTDGEVMTAHPVGEQDEDDVVKKKKREEVENTGRIYLRLQSKY